MDDIKNMNNANAKGELISGLKIDALKKISGLMSEYISNVESFDIEGFIEAEVEKRVQERLDNELKLERERMRKAINGVIDMEASDDKVVNVSPAISISETPVVNSLKNKELADYINDALDAPSGGLQKENGEIDEPILSEEVTNGLNEGLVESNSLRF